MTDRFNKYNSRDTSMTRQPTTAQSLGALLKSARDIMRKDKGLNGGLDRLPILTWIMFLKFLEGLEQSANSRQLFAAGHVEDAACANGAF